MSATGRHPWKTTPGPVERFVPAAMRAALTMPPRLAPGRVGGRVEVCIGGLGDGKTTWAVHRARHLARATGRQLATSGVDWPDEWVRIDSWKKLFELADTVVVLDELHTLMPRTSGWLTKTEAAGLAEWLTLVRKWRVDVIGTTVAWRRIDTLAQAVCTTAWDCSPVIAGRLHQARPFDPDTGKQAWGSQFFRPAWAAIPSHAVAWTGRDRMGLLEAAESEDRTAAERGPDRNGAAVRRGPQMKSTWRQMTPDMTGGPAGCEPVTLPCPTDSARSLNAHISDDCRPG